MIECRNAFGAGMLTSRALTFTSSMSCSSISSRSSGKVTQPRLLKLSMCDPATETETLRIITSLFCSASTTASCTHFMAVSKSTISPLRTPREGDWPTPRILIVPSGRPSPTTTQIFEVPISRPTIKSLLPICFLLSWRRHRDGPANGWRDRTGGMFGRWSDTRSCRRVRVEFERLMKRDCFHAARLLLRLDCLIDYVDSRFGKRGRNVPLHHQIGRSQLLLRIVAVDQKFFEAL